MGSGSVKTVPTETETLTVTTMTRVLMPIAGSMPLTAKILSMTSDTTIFAASDCTTSASTCIFVEPITFTAAPSTYFFNGSDHWNILGQLDCSISQGPRTAACAWTVGSYPSSEVANLTKSWITTPAASSTTILPTITDISTHSLQAFVNVYYQEDVYVTYWATITATSTARGARLDMMSAMVTAMIPVMLLLLSLFN